MPYRNIFEKDIPAHIISRSIEERKIFSDEEDCFRFIFQAYAANIGSPARTLWRQDVIKLAKAILEGERISSRFILKEHDPLVNFLDFSLVVTHYHFYLTPNSENSIPAFIRNFNNGFAQFFNQKHNRKGVLFNGPYRAIITKTQLQADTVSRYVSVINTLDVFQPKWREQGLKNPKEAFEFLKSYQFSSFPDKIGERKSKILASAEILEKYLTIGADIKTYQEFVKNFLNERSDLIREFFLE
ncbi:MAG: transposase [Candidatus Nealsonbacteria bacterium]|nr:transposase [Candidatus Nealsonbacteria bacterium]